MNHTKVSLIGTYFKILRCNTFPNNSPTFFLTSYQQCCQSSLRPTNYFFLSINRKSL